MRTGPVRPRRGTAPHPRLVRTTLSDLEIQRALGTLPGWARRGDALVKTFAFRSWGAGISFVNRVSDLAERANHHPDLDVRYGKVTVSLSTHDAGGITQADLSLASSIERAATSQPSE